MPELVEQEPCPRCGERVSLAEPACPRCKGKLLVDVVLVTAPADGRSRYQIARGLSKIGPGAPSFAAAQQTVAIPDSVLASAVTREVARKALAIVEEHGGHAKTMAAVEDSPISAPKAGRLATVAIMALLLVAGGIPLWKYLQHRKDETEQLGLRDPDPTQGPELGRQALAERAAAATVSLRCGSRTGSGFFVGRELVLTNAHVLCGQGESLRAVFSKDRELAATPGQRDDWLDLALVRVPGANAEPLPLGDATSLRKGDQTLTIGSPEGSDTVQDGIVSNRLHSIFGIGFLEIEANLSQRNSGSPLLDNHGLVVGVISLEKDPAQGFALPINYAFSGETPLLRPPDRPAPSPERWSKLLADVASADRRDVQGMQGDLGRPALVGFFLPRTGGLGAVVALHSRRRPTRQTMTFYFRDTASRTICKIEAATDDWRKMSDTRLSATEGARSRYIQWIRKNGLEEKVYVSFAELDLPTCKGDRTRAVELLLERADNRADSISL